jgi:hypothetical protein
VVAYADNGYIKGKFSVTFQVLSEIKRVLKEDVMLKIVKVNVITQNVRLKVNVSKTSIISKDITQQVVFDVDHSFISSSPGLLFCLLVLKVSLVSVCLLVLMILYRTL